METLFDHEKLDVYGVEQFNDAGVAAIPRVAVSSSSSSSSFSFSVFDRRWFTGAENRHRNEGRHRMRLTH
jgi:hypothetical protein